MAAGKKPKPFQVLLVCTGNICRSAMAEGLLKKKLAQEKESLLQVSSAGIAAGDGNPATLEAVEAAAVEGVDIRAHRARALTREIMDGADLVLVMADMHYNWILDLNPDYLHKTYLLRVFGRSKAVPRDREIPDPFGGGSETYRHCFRAVAAEVKRVLPTLKKLARKGGRS